MRIDDKRVCDEQLRQALAMEPFALAATLINATITYAVMRGHAPAVVLTSWFAYLLVVALGRSVLLRHYRRVAGSEASHSRNYCLLGVALAGLGWGALGAILYPVESLAYQVFIAFVLGGMTAGAAVAYSSLRFAFALYSVPALVPLIVRLAVTGDAMHSAMAAMVSLFAVLMFRTSARLRSATCRTLVLRFENEALVERLRQEQQRTESANQQLRMEIERRQEADRQLQGSLSELQRSNQDLAMFASAASHDLRAPMRRISGFAAILVSEYGDVVDKEGRDYLERMIVSADRMQALVSDLLSYASIGREDLVRTPVDLRHLVAEVCVALEVPIQEAGAEVVVEDMPTVPVHERLLSTVFQNLFSNAIKFRGDAPPRVHVSARREGDEWVVAVRDNGIGLKQEYLDSVFNAFCRLHSASDYPGTGIGLAVCRRVVERHGGRMWAESQPGEGSTFLFSIPVQMSHEVCPSIRQTGRSVQGGE
jgi:signal transduction histidine kinase